MSELRAVPRIDIYGEECARRVLSGEYHYDWGVPSGVTNAVVHLYGGGGHGGSAGGGGSSNYIMVSGSGYASGGFASVSGGGGGGNSSWGSAHWACYAFGNSVLTPGDLLAGGTC